MPSPASTIRRCARFKRTLMRSVRGALPTVGANNEAPNFDTLLSLLACMARGSLALFDSDSAQWLVLCQSVLHANDACSGHVEGHRTRCCSHKGLARPWAELLPSVLLGHVHGVCKHRAPACMCVDGASFCELKVWEGVSCCSSLSVSESASICTHL